MYAEEDKIRALVALKENEFNFEKTSKQLNVNRLTLRKWYKEKGETVYKDLELRGEGLHLKETYDAALTVVADDIRRNHENFINRVLEAKTKAIERAIEIVTKEKDLNKLTNILKTLHEITQSDSHTEDKNNTNVFIAFLMDKYNLK